MLCHSLKLTPPETPRKEKLVAEMLTAKSASCAADYNMHKIMFQTAAMQAYSLCLCSYSFVTVTCAASY